MTSYWSHVNLIMRIAAVRVRNTVIWVVFPNYSLDTGRHSFLDELILFCPSSQTTAGECIVARCKLPVTIRIESIRKMSVEDVLNDICVIA